MPDFHEDFYDCLSAEESPDYLAYEGRAEEIARQAAIHNAWPIINQPAKPSRFAVLFGVGFDDLSDL